MSNRKGVRRLATIKDIADRAKVSPATVSRVLNGDKNISVREATRKKIYEAAEELEYVPMIQKYIDRTQKNAQISLLVVSSYTEQVEIEDPYYLSIRYGIETECRKNMFDTIKLYREEGYINFNLLEDKRIDGVIAIGSFYADEIDKLNAISENLVFVDTSPDESKYDAVLVNLRKAIATMVGHLLERGFTKIGYIGGRDIDMGFESIDIRETEFIEQMKKLGLYNESYMILGNFSIDSAYEMTLKYISEKKELPEAFVMANDSIAIGALRAFQQNKIKVPRDLSIISINDIPTAKFTYPPLTTIKIHSEYLGITAVRLVMDRIQNKRGFSMKIFVGMKLIERESVMNKRGIACEHK